MLGLSCPAPTFPGCGTPSRFCGSAPPLPTRLAWAWHRSLCMVGSDAGKGMNCSWPCLERWHRSQPAPRDPGGCRDRVLLSLEKPPGPRWELTQGKLGLGSLSPGWAFLGGTLAAPELPTCLFWGFRGPCAAVLGDPSLTSSASCCADSQTHGLTLGTGNELVASFPGQALGPLPPPPSTRRGHPQAGPAPPWVVRCAELPGPRGAVG